MKLIRVNWSLAIAFLLLAQVGFGSQGPRNNHLELNVYGFGSPVGLAGALYTYQKESDWAPQIGIGEGLSGTQLALNAIYAPQLFSNGWNQGILVGFTYASGVAEDGQHSEDFLWSNLSWQLNYQATGGFRYGIELGLTTVIAEALFRTNTFNKDQLQRHMFGGIDPRFGGYNVGTTFPQISLLKMGYAW